MTYKQRGWLGLGCLGMATGSFFGAILTSDFKERVPQAFTQLAPAAYENAALTESDPTSLNPVSGWLMVAGFALTGLGYAKIMEEEPATVTGHEQLALPTASTAVSETVILVPIERSELLTTL